MYIDVFEGGFLSALAVRDHYSVAVGCLWGCSQAENRASERARRDEAVALSTFRKGRLLTEKVANLKGPPALLSPRGMRKNKRTAREGAEERSAHV